MRIFTEHRIENRLAAGNKGILTNGEKRKSALSCCRLAFYQTLHKKAEPLNNEFRSFKVRFEM